MLDTSFHSNIGMKAYFRLEPPQKETIMLSKIKVTPLAAESFGVRSMCTLAETPDVTLLLDAGISLAAYRFSLLPHPQEFQVIARLRQRIAEAAEKAQVVTISHYHFDHHTPSFEDWLVNWTQGGETARQIYQKKTVLMKNPREHINPSQRERAWMFQRTGSKHASKLSIADGREFHFGKTTVRFSEAVPHGPEDAILGWVVMLSVEYDGEKFMHAPDVQGPMSDKSTAIIMAERPDLLMVGGPPFYLGAFKVDEAQLQKGLSNLKAIVQAVPVTMMEHHALRDEQWRQKTQPIFAAAKAAGHQVLTASEFAGEENLFLESRRKELYAEDPPSDEFKKWTKLDSRELSHVKPPIL
jgi:predicted metallo-beta-lactamase superfamily hydrolase